MRRVSSCSQQRLLRRETLNLTLEDTTYENAVNKELREIHRMVETVKEDPEVAGMRIQMVEDIIKMQRENEKLAEEITKQAEEITRQAEENAKLKEELARIKDMGASTGHIVTGKSSS